MTSENDGTTRRDVIRKSGVSIGIAAGLAGCTGGSSGNGGGSENSNGNDNSGGSSNGNDNSGGSSNGNDNSGGSSEPQFAEFDPANPEYPQPGDVLLEHGFQWGTAEDLERWRNRDIEEPAYGQDVLPLRDDYQEPDEWLEPDTLVYTLGHGEASKQEYVDQLGPLMDNVEAETGIPVDYQVISSRAAAIEGMRSERIHFGRPGATVHPVNLAGGVPFAFPVRENEEGDLEAGYCWWITSHVSRTEMNAPEDIMEQTVAHSSETSTSGHQAPSALLKEQFDIVPGEDYEIEFSGGHNASIKGVELEDYDAANHASSNFSRMNDADEIDPSNFRIMHRQVLPSGAQQYLWRLHPDIRAGIRRAYFDYEYDEGLAANVIDGPAFVEMEPEDYKKFYHTQLTIHKSLGIEYETS